LPRIIDNNFDVRLLVVEVQQKENTGVIGSELTLCQTTGAPSSIDAHMTPTKRKR
jgi:hypothetical protein